MKIMRLRSTIVRPADATQYAAGDEVSNNATAGSVARMTFNLAGFAQGKVKCAEIDIAPASGNVVTTALDLEALIFRTGDVPAAVGDNVTNPISAAVRSKAIGYYRFDDTGWTGPLGTVAAGTSQVQAVMPTAVQPLATPVMQYPWNDGFVFDFNGYDTKTFTVVIRALSAWNPTNIVNTIGLTLDIEAEAVGG